MLGEQLPRILLDEMTRINPGVGLTFCPGHLGGERVLVSLCANQRIRLPTHRQQRATKSPECGRIPGP